MAVAEAAAEEDGRPPICPKYGRLRMFICSLQYRIS